MAIGTGWADGAWIDAGWVTGAWESTNNTTINVGLDTLTLTDNNVTVNAETSFTVNLDSVTLTDNNVTLNTETAFTVGLDSLTLTDLNPAINAETSITANLDTLTLSEFAATIATDGATIITAGLDTLTLTEFAATIQAGDAVEEPVDVAHGRGGGGNVGILYKGFKLPDAVEAFQIDDTPNPTPTFASEIERRNAAIRSLAEQIKTVEQEAQQLRQTEDLNNQIRAEELALDTFHVEQFIEQLAIDMQELRLEKRRREEEELITILLNSWNVKIH